VTSTNVYENFLKLRFFLLLPYCRDFSKWNKKILKKTRFFAAVNLFSAAAS